MPDKNNRVRSIGECMIELSDLGGGRLSLAYGGDSLNTALYMARLGVPVDYATALGDDPWSEEMLAFWRGEGVGTDLVQRLPGRLPGLYMIKLAEGGERSFYYWRSAAAAREMLKAGEPDRLAAALQSSRLLYFSGITLSILDEESRGRLLAIVARAKANGARIAFDSNYRKRGWPDAEAARAAMTEAFRLADIALPTLDDEQALHGDADAEAAARRILALGPSEVAVKLGAEGALVAEGGRLLRIPAEQVKAVDTTAAGDGFNAGYLAARLAGVEPEAAGRAAAKLAAVIVQHRGAVVPKEAMPAGPLW
jgi:2-dehydro-3-deoxygluconokinase